MKHRTQKEWAEAQAAQVRRHEDEAARIAEVKAGGAVPQGCAPGVYVDAPARGMGYTFPTDRHHRTPRGLVRSRAIKRGDAFDVAEAFALRAKARPPFTPAQREIGREYAELSLMIEAAGLSCLDMNGSGGGTATAGVSEATSDNIRRLRMLNRRIGNQLVLRKVRPSTRGVSQARPIPAIDLITRFCLYDHNLGAILEAFGWSNNGRMRGRLRAELCAVLDRMRGVSLTEPQNID